MNCYHLQRAMYVLNMNRHKPRTKATTVARLEREVVEQCRVIVMEADRLERQRRLMRRAWLHG